MSLDELAGVEHKLALVLIVIIRDAKKVYFCMQAPPASSWVEFAGQRQVEIRMKHVVNSTVR